MRNGWVCLLTRWYTFNTFPPTLFPTASRMTCCTTARINSGSKAPSSSRWHLHVKTADLSDSTDLRNRESLEDTGKNAGAPQRGNHHLSREFRAVGRRANFNHKPTAGLGYRGGGLKLRHSPPPDLPPRLLREPGPHTHQPAAVGPFEGSVRRRHSPTASPAASDQKLSLLAPSCGAKGPKDPTSAG
jgi:hypothetical protein